MRNQTLSVTEAEWRLERAVRFLVECEQEALDAALDEMPGAREKIVAACEQALTKRRAPEGRTRQADRLQQVATDLFHEWARLPGYEPMDEEMAIALVCRIRDALIKAENGGLR